jgi:hypothetical protein
MAEMFDVYLSSRRDNLLVVAKGDRIPASLDPLGWRKKRAASSVSVEIKFVVKRDGYYRRKLSERSIVFGNRIAPGA